MNVSKVFFSTLAVTSVLILGIPGVQAATAPRNLAKATILGARDLRVDIDGRMQSVITDPTWLLYAPDGTRLLFGLAPVDLRHMVRPVFRAYAELLGRGNDTLDLIIHWPSKSSVENQHLTAHIATQGAAFDMPFPSHARIAAGLADISLRLLPLTGRRGEIALSGQLGFLTQAQG